MKRLIFGLMMGLLLIGVNVLAGDGDLIVNGNVGIGTTSPGELLELYKTSKPALRFINGVVEYNQFIDTSNNMHFGSPRGSGDVANDTRLFVLRENGNVGIGTTNPEATLSVISTLAGNTAQFGSATDNTTVHIRNTATGGRAFHLASSGGNSGYGQGKFTIADEAAGVRLAIDASGNVGIGTVSPGDYKLFVNGSAYTPAGIWSGSDVKFKKDILPVNDALAKVLKIKGYSYEWKREEFKDKEFPEGRHYGVIAQEIEEVIPEAVRDNEDGTKAVSYTEIIPVLIEAIKEQQKLIDKQQKEIDQLKEEVAQIK